MLNIFKKTPQWQKENPKYVIEKAFTLGGKQYYQLNDFVNIPCERALVAIQYYNELDMKVDKAFLNAHIVAVTDALNRGKLNEVVQLTNDLKNRSEKITDYDTVLRLASVLYFDENESHLTYDESYNEKKIAEWKKLKVDTFFLAVPLQHLVPCVDLSKIDSQTFTNLTILEAKTKINQIENIILSITPNKVNQDLLSSLELQIIELKQLIQLNA